MDLEELFVFNLKKWRKNRGLSQKTLAERCNAAHSYIRQIESGKGHPSFAFIRKLAAALDIEAYRLFYDEEAAKSSLLTQIGPLETAETTLMIAVNHEIHTAFDTLKKHIPAP
jgi:transcriptional regulator with XRE-family HTH domain